MKPETEDAFKRSEHTWNKIDVVLKGISAVIVTLAISALATANQQTQFKIAEDNRKAQMLVQTIAGREAASADLRARVFDTLIRQYYTSSKTLDEEVALLKLMGLNFQDHLQLKPLFENLAERLEASRNQEGLAKLRKAARGIASHQLDLVRGAGGTVFTRTLHQGVDCDAANIPTMLKLREVADDHIRIVTAKDDTLGFEVNFFDTPFVDNTTLGEVTFAIRLASTSPSKGEAVVDLVVFPNDYFDVRNNLRMDGLLAAYMRTGH